jgi:hypothetical protein
MGPAHRGATGQRCLRGHLKAGRFAGSTRAEFQESAPAHQKRDPLTQISTAAIERVQPWTSRAKSVIRVVPASENRDGPGISVELMSCVRPAPTSVPGRSSLRDASLINPFEIPY